MFSWFSDLLYHLPYIPGLIFAFFIVLIVHEFGHYGMARLLRMRVETFSIGIGRRLWSYNDQNGTLWTFHMFPIGGHVMISDLNMHEEKQSKRAVWERISVVLAGPIANLVSPFFLFLVCFMLVGYPYRPPLVTGVEQGFPAVEAGIQAGDRITFINGTEIFSFEDVADYIDDSRARELEISLMRGDEDLVIPVQPVHHAYIDMNGIARDEYKIGILNALNPMPLRFVHTIEGINTEDNEDVARSMLMSRFDEPVNIGLYGVDDEVHSYRLAVPASLNMHFSDPDDRYFDSVYLGPLKTNTFSRLPLSDAAYRAWHHWGELLGLVVQIPLQIFPIDHRLYADRVLFTGIEYFWESIIYKALYTASLISLILCFINLVPFPRLDGDYLMYYVMESILRKRPSRKMRATAIMVVLFSIYCVFLFANLEDIPGYLQRKVEDLSEKFE